MMMKRVLVKQLENIQWNYSILVDHWEMFDNQNHPIVEENVHDNRLDYPLNRIHHPDEDLFDIVHM